MNADFHYYAAYCAAIIAGYSHEESQDIAYGSQFTDCCSRTYLEKIGGPLCKEKMVYEALSEPVQADL